MNRNISIIWDFDGTLTPDRTNDGKPMDSTSQTIKVLSDERQKFVDEFWSDIKKLKNDSQDYQMEHVLASDAPIWMYLLSQLAEAQRIPLNKEFFKKYIVPKIQLYKGVIPFLKKIKDIQKGRRFQKAHIKIHHFIVSAGLKDLIEEIFPEDIMTYIFGCRYKVAKFGERSYVNIPVFCMDETMKTRSVFEIAKGTFQDPKKRINKRMSASELWSQYSDMIYIGDGPTDIPALSVVKARGGYGAIVYNDQLQKKELKVRLKDLSLDQRADVIVPSDFSTKGKLFEFLKTRCYQILQSYEAKDFVTSQSR